MQRNPSTDSELMIAVGAGESFPLEELFRRHSRSVFAFFKRSCGDASVAEDLTQDVFLRLLRYGASFDRDRAFKPWLFSVAHNVLRDHFNDATRKIAATTETIENPDPRPDQSRRLEAKDRLARVEASLALLSDEQRMTLILARFHDLSYREIAQILGCSEGAVKARVYRALHTLSKLLDRMESSS